MAYLVGTDEAGYGPNLGPLVIAGTLWSTPEVRDADSLYDQLPGVVAPGKRASAVGSSLVLGDSKALYQPKGGLAALERGVFAALSALPNALQPDAPRATADWTWRTFLERCDASVGESLGTIPWYTDGDRCLPIDADNAVIDSAGQLLRKALHVADIQLLDIRAVIVFPESFNHRVQLCDSKGQALSLWTLELIDSLVQRLPNGPILIQGDKHGGRNRYAALLQHVFPDHLIEVLTESRLISSYRWGTPERPVEARFIARGEQFLPAALASMFAKYIRELAMMAFNAFWQHQLPQLRPTAGYPQDAKRFRSEIAAVQRALAIPDRMLWRER